MKYTGGITRCLFSNTTNVCAYGPWGALHNGANAVSVLLCTCITVEHSEDSYAPFMQRAPGLPMDNTCVLQNCASDQKEKKLVEGRGMHVEISERTCMQGRTTSGILR